MKTIALIAFALAATATDAQTQWRVVEFKNEWGEYNGSGAFSEWTKPIRPLPFPYNDVEAALSVECEGVVIRFTEMNLAGYDDNHRITVRIDGKQESWETIESTSGRALIVTRGRGDRVNKMLAATTFGFAVDWYRGATAAFAFDMAGMADAVVQIQNTDGTTCYP